MGGSAATDIDTELRRMTYSQFLDMMKKKWEPGQHVGVIGPTGCGKTFAVRDLLALRRYVVAFATKSKDKTLDGYTFVKRDSWPPEWHQRQILLWKKPARLGDFSEQQKVFYFALADIYKRGGFTVYFDDLYFLVQTLGLKKPLQMFYTQVRSQGVSIIASMQRPSWVIDEALSQTHFLLIFRIHGKLDIEKLAAAAECQVAELKKYLQQLQPYEFIILEVGKPPIIVQKKEK